MKTKNLFSLIATGIYCALISTAQAADAPDPKAGKYKFDTCTGCHAIPGYTMAYPTYHVPKLGGQHAQYIIAALTAYQAGDRKHPTMVANAANLNTQDMADIAAYLSDFKPSNDTPPISGNVSAGKKKSEPCQACHGQDGNNSDPNFPRLAGQYEDYLIKALKDYQSGERRNAIMNGMAAGLSEQDQHDLAAYYASRDNGLAVIEY